MRRKIIYDGWSLAYAPNHPASIHLLTLLEAHPQSLAAAVALPADSFHALPGWVEAIYAQAADTPRGRLHWEQNALPVLARASGAALLHTLSGSPVWASASVVASPAEWDAWDGQNTLKPEKPLGLAARLRLALASGGLARSRAIFWPKDLQPPAENLPFQPLAPAVHPCFSRTEGIGSEAMAEIEALDLPETYILYHGSTGAPHLRSLLDAWSWAAASIGGYYPLVVAGCSRADWRRLSALLAEYELDDSVRSAPPLSLAALAELYRRSQALFHPSGIPAWGDPVRRALTVGLPVVGSESARLVELVGPAAYLARADGGYAAGRRALGAALISVIVEDTLSAGLARAGQDHAANWNFETFRKELEEHYLAL